MISAEVICSLNCGLIGRFPIVVRGEERIAAVQFQRRINQRAGDAGGRSDAAKEDSLVCVTLDDETGDEDVVAGFDPHPGGNISEL